MPLIRLPAPSPAGGEKEVMATFCPKRESGAAMPFSPLAGRRSRQRDEGQPLPAATHGSLPESAIVPRPPFV